MKYAFSELLTDIAKPFAVGILIAGVITFFFPEDLTVWANDHRLLSMLVMLIAGIPMYVCATSSTPIAAALILKGLNPGAALVFLLAGPATNAATINIVRNVVATISGPPCRDCTISSGPGGSRARRHGTRFALIGPEQLLQNAAIRRQKNRYRS